MGDDTPRGDAQPTPDEAADSTADPTTERRGTRPHHHRHHRGIVIGGVLLGIGLVVGIVTSVTPWPSAMLIRAVFEQGGTATAAEMRQYVPESGVNARTDIEYGDAGADTSLDVFTPASDTGATTDAPPRATIVWIHGGAWISGQKENVDPYLRILASHGYAAIGLNYTVAPEAVYPTAVTQLNDALGFITEHAEEWGVDPDRIILAGDSAGAQLASQLAVLTTNPQYAHLIGIEPRLEPKQLIATILNCGVFDLQRMADLNGIEAWGFKVALWGYTGTKDWSSTYAGSTMSTIDFVTADFPPTYISGGNGDALTWIESVPMSSRLQQAGVDVTELFWSANHEPKLPHEYQFHLDLPDAQTALNETLAFLERIAG
ncbi:alpha/beta hydrolase [Plantibacter sp. YIM 135249]|uniref:alpha/beta hydrolase n=1 Tax=Plantibacter sp. YIM 135249 TaxID=3423918 RepID=UPI003D336372